ncbi:hypothetical protein ACJZ2D_008350 [Fusarium nematophilum]
MHYFCGLCKLECEVYPSGKCQQPTCWDGRGNFPGWHWPTPSSEDPVDLCHAGCFELVDPGWILEARKATLDSFPPAASLSTRRACRLQMCYTLILARNIRLPKEICRGIASFCCPREQAVRVIQDVRPKPHAVTLAVDESTTVWAQHVKFEGIRYIKSLACQSTGEEDTPLFTFESQDRANI